MTNLKMIHSNVILREPPSWDNEKYGKCDVLYATNMDGVYYSYWKLTWREKWRVLFGIPIRLCIASDTHPPVALDTDP